MTRLPSLSLGLDLSLPRLGLSGIGRQRSKRPISPEEEESMLRQIGHKSMGAAAGLGNLLDLPGSMVRDVVAGKNPFDQLLTMTSAENRETEGNLLRSAGLIGKDDTWSNLPARLATAIVLDPLTYMSFGAAALGKAGKAARATGLLDTATRVASAKAGKIVGKRVANMSTTLGDLLHPSNFATAEKAAEKTLEVERAAAKTGSSLAELSGQKLGGAWALHVPFTGLTQPLPGGRWLASGLDVAASALAKTKLGRAGRMLFDERVMGKWKLKEQQIAEGVYAGKLAAKHEEMGTILKATRGLNETFDTFKGTYGTALGLDPNKPGTLHSVRKIFGEIVRDTAERAGALSTSPTVAHAAGAFQDITKNRAGQVSFSMADAIAKRSDEMTAVMRKIGESVKSKGGPLKFLPEMEDFGYFARYVDVGGPGQYKDASNRIADTMFPSMLARTPETRMMRRSVVNRLVVDGNARMRPPKAGIAYILQNYGNDLDAAWVGKKGVVGKQEHAKALYGWLKKHEPNELYRRLEIEDFATYVERGTRVDASYDAIHWYLRDSVHDLDDTLQNLAHGRITPEAANDLINKNGVSLEDTFSAAGMDSDAALQHFSKTFRVPVDKLADFYTSPETGAAIRALLEPQMSNQTWAIEMGARLDDVLGAIRSAITLPFPGFHVRNQLSGQYLNVSTGYIETPADLAAYVASIGKAKSARGDYFKGGNALTDDMQAYGQFGKTSGGRMHGRMNVRDVNTSEQSFMTRMLGSIPGTKGVVGKGYGKVEQVGGNWLERVEYFNRAPMYLYLKDHKGYTSQAAADVVTKLQFDYSRGAFTPFENQAMKRSFLFYSFTRKMAPLLLDQVIGRPGGPLAQTMKAVSRARGTPDKPLPEYLEQTAAIPMGMLQDGSQRFFTGFGLPQEDILEFGNRPLNELGSRLNPFLKAPIELMTGQSLWQRGKELRDMDPLLGRIAANVQGKRGRAYPLFGSNALEFAAAQPPWYRYFTGVRELTSLIPPRQPTAPRKGAVATLMPLFTGFRITDVPPASQDAVIRERANELMKDIGARAFSKMFFPKDMQARMAPEERARAEQWMGLQRLLDQRLKKQIEANKKAKAINRT